MNPVSKCLASTSSCEIKPCRTPAFAGVGWMAAFVLCLAGCLETTAGAALRLPLLGLTLFALAGLIRSQRRSGNPMFPPRLLRIRAVLCADILTACHGGVLVSFLTVVPLYQSIVLGDDVGRITWLLLAITLGSGLSGLTVGHVISRTGHLATFPRVSLPLAAIGVAVLALAGDALARPVLIGLYGGIGMTLGTVMAVAMSTIMIAAPVDLLGRAAGNITFFRSVGALGVTALTSLVLFALAPGTGTGAEHVADWRFAFQGAYATIILFIVLAWLTTWPMPARMSR